MGDAKAQHREVAGSSTWQPMLSPEQSAAQITHARQELEAAISALRQALWQDAQLRVGAAFALVRDTVGDIELKVEQLLSRVPAVGPRIAVELHNRVQAAGVHGKSPTNGGFSVEAPVPAQQQDIAAEYLDCIGMHVA